MNEVKDHLEATTSKPVKTAMDMLMSQQERSHVLLLSLKDRLALVLDTRPEVATCVESAPTPPLVVYCDLQDYLQDRVSGAEILNGTLRDLLNRLQIG